MASLRVHRHFPTLVFQKRVDDSTALNASLLRFILAEREADGLGIERSNVAELGGWHSRTTLHQEPQFQPLIDEIASVVETLFNEFDYHPDMSFSLNQMWAVINPPGAYNHEHVHSHSLWSGVYYVQVPDAAGPLILRDPRPGNVMSAGQSRPGAEKIEAAKLSVFHEPVEGELTLFPGFLPHAVGANQSKKTDSDALRVAISFNMAQH